MMMSTKGLLFFQRSRTWEIGQACPSVLRAVSFRFPFKPTLRRVPSHTHNHSSLVKGYPLEDRLLCFSETSIEGETSEGSVEGRPSDHFAVA